MAGLEDSTSLDCRQTRQNNDIFSLASHADHSQRIVAQHDATSNEKTHRENRKKDE